MLTLKDFKIVPREDFNQDMVDNTYPKTTELLVHKDIWWIECDPNGFFVSKDGFTGIGTTNLLEAMKYLYEFILAEAGTTTTTNQKFNQPQ